MMPRSSSIGLILTVLLALAVLSVGRYSAERYSLSTDVQQGVAYIKKINAAEQRCYAARGYYVSLMALRSKECGLDEAIASGRYDDYRFELKVDGSAYSIRAYPSSNGRLISLYSDERGEIRLGTRNYPADSNSKPLPSQH